MLASTLQARPPHAAAEAAPDVFYPVPQDEQRLAGILSTRMRANTEGYLEHIEARKLLADPVSTGLFLIAAANSYAYSEDAQLKKVMDRVAHAVIKSPPEAETPRAQATLVAGLVAYGEETGEEEALDTARKLANSYLPQASPTMIGPFVNLYRATDDDRYLQAARSLARKSLPPADPDREIFLTGLVTYYRQTGDDAALNKSAQAWRTIHSTVAGAPDASSDTCASAVWFEWTNNLLRATGQIGYAEALEATLYNQLLAAQEAQSGAVYGTVSLNGEKRPDTEGSACAAAEAWALADLPEAIWGRLENGIALFNYSPGRASFRLRRRTTVQVYAEGNYPQSGELLLHIEPSRDTRFHLFLRVPRWSRKFTVESGETRLAGKPGELVNLVRDWKKGDIVKITIGTPVTEVSDPANPNILALQRGPQVLAAINRDKMRSDLGSLQFSAQSASSLSAAGEIHGSSEPMFGQVFQTDGFDNGTPIKLMLVPFADAVSPYRVWLPKR